MSAAAAQPVRQMGGAPDGKRSLRLWLRLLTCSHTIEQTIAQRLRDEFGSTLPRFDMLSALARPVERRQHVEAGQGGAEFVAQALGDGLFDGVGAG